MEVGSVIKPLRAAGCMNIMCLFAIGRQRENDADGGVVGRYRHGICHRVSTEGYNIGR